MAISMSEYINRKGLGQEVNPEDVTLSMNDLGRLQRLQAVDPMSSPYVGANVAQAQGFVGDLPMAADLGLMLQQNRQIEAAGGRGYAGNVHNLQGQTTPFEKLAQSVSSNTRPMDAPLSDQQRYGTGGDGNGGESTGVGMSGDVLGPYGMSTLSSAAKGYGLKGLTGFGLATAMGAPLGVGLKYGITSAIPGPLGALGFMGSMAYSGLLDKSLTDTAGAYGFDEDAFTSEDVEAHREAIARATELGVPTAAIAKMREEAPYDVDMAAQTLDNYDEMGFLGRVQKAFGALKDTFSEMGTDFSSQDRSLAAINRAMSRDPMFAGAAGLDPTFGGSGGDGGFGGFGGFGSDGGFGGMGMDGSDSDNGGFGRGTGSSGGMSGGFGGNDTGGMGEY